MPKAHFTVNIHSERRSLSIYLKLFWHCFTVNHKISCRLGNSITNGDQQMRIDRVAVDVVLPEISHTFEVPTELLYSHWCSKINFTVGCITCFFSLQSLKQLLCPVWNNKINLMIGGISFSAIMEMAGQVIARWSSFTVLILQNSNSTDQLLLISASQYSKSDFNQLHYYHWFDLESLLAILIEGNFNSS